MRARLRKMLSYLFLTVGVAIIVAVFGEFFIEVARAKGMYNNAAQRWDRIVSAVFAFLTSAWVVIPFIFLSGAVAMLWLDYFLKKTERAPGLSAKQVEALVAERIAAATPAETLRLVPLLDHLPESSDKPSVTLEQVESTFAERFGNLFQAVSDIGDMFVERDQAEEKRKKAETRKDELISKLFTKFEEKVDESILSLNRRINNLQDGLDVVSNRGLKAHEEQREFQEEMEQWVQNLWATFGRRIENVDQGFMAILDRENLLNLATGIQNVGDDLSGPTRGEPIVDWDAWFKGYRIWHRDVTNWARIAGEYRNDVEPRIFTAYDEDYRQDWGAKDSLFPDATAVREYRTFCTIQRNFHAKRSHVDTAVRMAAFVKPSMKGNVYPSPRDADQLPQPRQGTE